MRQAKQDRAVEVSIVEGEGDLCGMMFHETDVRRLLASVGKIVDAGNRVVFGPGKMGSYVESLRTNKKIYLENPHHTTDQGYCMTMEYYSTRIVTTP